MATLKEELKMKAKRNALITALKTVKPALAKKEITEQGTHVVFSGENICAFNDHICIIHKFPTDFICSAPAEEFYKILEKLPGDEIDITFKHNKLTMKSDGTRGGVSTQAGDELLKKIDILINKEKRWIDIPKDFMEGLGLCSFSASKDMGNPVLTGIYIDDDVVMSSDNLRMSQYFLKSGTKRKFLIPSATVSELLNFAVARYAVENDGNWAFFEMKDKTIFCAQLLTGVKYPSLEPYFDFEGVKFTFPESIKEAVEAALVVAPGDTDAERLIDIEIGDGVIVCRGENDLAWLEKEFKADINLQNKKTLKFSINPFFLLKILTHTYKAMYSETKILFIAKNFYHLIAVRTIA